jgi:hypothetical protein
LRGEESQAAAQYQKGGTPNGGCGSEGRAVLVGGVSFSSHRCSSPQVRQRETWCIGNRTKLKSNSAAPQKHLAASSSTI